MPTYRVAIKLSGIEPVTSTLAAHRGAIAIDDAVTVTQTDTGTRISGSIDEVRAAALPGIKLPARFDEVVSPPILDAPAGTSHIQTTIGRLRLDWQTRPDGLLVIAVDLQANALSALLFARLLFTGGAKPIAEVAPPDIVVTPPSSSIDDIDVSKAKLTGAHRGTNPAKAQPTRLLKSVRISGTESIRFEHEILGWPDNSPVGENIDGRCYIYWRDGDALTGGQFDWKRPASNGVSVKDTKNLHNGYLPTPAVGAVLWFCLVSNDGRERTNVRQSSTLWGGGAAPSTPDVPATPAPTVPSGGDYPAHPRDVVGVGLDYVWPLEDHDRLCRELKAAGCTATGIELMGGWSRRSGGADAWKYGIQRAAWESMLAACRRHRILLFVSIFNSNKGLGKYGDDKKPGSRYDSLVREYMAMVMAAGPEGVWVQPVSETQDPDYDGDYAGKIEREFIPKFNKAGFVTVYNNGSRPSKPGAGSKFHAHHVFKLSDTGSANALVNTDTGTAITSLTNGGIYGATLKPDACAGFVTKVRATGNRGALIYTFTGLTGIPSAAITAVGKAWGSR